ncbi:MAG: hypothetical protein H7210_14335 [Pyrinomonadaceae bacterium]|nr:hypothetical protein [Phycisphaerales bacterium]
MNFDLLLTRSPLEWAMIAGGLGALFLGVLVLRSKRLRKPLDEDSIRLEAELPLVGTVSESTRLLVATTGLVLGYHLIVWAFPAGITPIQAPRQYWWLVVVVAGIVIVASIVTDRAEQRRE